MRRRLAVGLMLSALLGGAVAAHRVDSRPTLSTVTLDAPPTNMVLNAHTGRAVITTPSHLWILDARTGRVLSSRVSPRLRTALPNGPCDNYVDMHWPSLAAATRGNPCAQAALRATPKDETMRRAVLIFNTAVVVLDAKTGTPVAPPVFAGIYSAMAAVDEQTHRAFVTVSSNGDRQVCTLDTRTGRLVARAGLLGFPGAPVVATRMNRVLIPNQDDTGTTRIDLLDAKTGRSLRSVILGRDVPSLLGQGVGPGQRIVVDARDNRVFVLGQASSASGNAIGPGRVTMLDARRASVMRTVAVEQNPRTMTFDERRGRVLILSRGPVTQQDLPAGGYIDVPMGAGSLSVLDAHNGRIIRTVPVGVNPTALTVDEPTGNVLVTTIGATIDAPDPYRWGWLPGWVQERLSSLLPRTHHVHAVKPMVSVLDVTR